MRSLGYRPERCRRVVDRSRSGETQGHPLRKRPTVVRDGNERPGDGVHNPVPLRNRRQHVLQRAAARPPELVGVAQEHPVGAVLGGRKTRHARHPRSLTDPFTLLADQANVALPLVGLEDLSRTVARAVVRSQDEIHPRVEMKRDVSVDDVRFVAAEERHDELHGLRASTTLIARQGYRDARRTSGGSRTESPAVTRRFMVGRSRSPDARRDETSRGGPAGAARSKGSSSTSSRAVSP